MPLYRYECARCCRVDELLLQLEEDPGPSTCCSAAQRLLMPRRVRAVVAPPTSPSERRAAPGTDGPMLRRHDPPPPRHEPGPLDIPAASYSGPPTSKADADSRWRDTTQAMAAWQARSLTADGVPYHQAIRRAEAHQQQVSARAEAESG